MYNIIGRIKYLVVAGDDGSATHVGSHGQVGDPWPGASLCDEAAYDFSATLLRGVAALSMRVAQPLGGVHRVSAANVG